MAFSAGIFMGLLTMVFWGVGDFLQAFVSKKIGGMKTFFLLNFLIFIFTLPFALYYFFIGELNFDLNYLWLFLVAGIVDVIGYYNFIKSLEIGEVSINAPIAATYPVVTVGLSLLVLKEVLSLQKIFAIMIILSGVILVSTNLSAIKKARPKGIKEAILSMLFFGILFFITGYLTRFIDQFTVFIVSIIIGQGMMVIYALMRKGIPAKKDLAKKNILLFMSLNAIFIIAAWFAFTKGMSTELVSIVSAVSSLYPAITVLLALIFLKEKLVLNQKIGIAVILLGIVMIGG